MAFICIRTYNICRSLTVLTLYPSQLAWCYVSTSITNQDIKVTTNLLLATPPLAMLSERYANRRVPLILGLITLIGSQIMFMEAPTYWLLCLARVLQGISSSAVWCAGFALL
jgi:DHA1 family solute carrier family 18 vesicular amine transporter 1/2